MSAHSPSNRVSEIVGGKYRILRFLAAGGMGTVYEAQHLVIGRHFAIKFLHPKHVNDPESMLRFKREAQAAGCLKSEHLVAPVDFGIVEDGSPFFVMELLVGHTLRTILDHLPNPPLERATDWVRQACQGMQVAHDAGIIHRDLNPRNLFLCQHEDGTDWIKVLDFGIARQDDTEGTVTQTGTVMGTPAYLSPEQARGDPKIEKGVDIYAFGVILFEMLCGQRPHQGNSPHSLLHHITSQPAGRLSDLRPGLPLKLVNVVEKAMHPEIKARHTTMLELARDLDAFATHVPWPTMTWAATNQVSKARQTKPTLIPPRRRISFEVYVYLTIGLAILALGFVTVHPTQSSFLTRPPLPVHTRFLAPPPNPAAIDQIAEFTKAKAQRQATLITMLGSIPQGHWLTQGTPEETHAVVAKIMGRASAQKAIPFLVSYNRPFRDCAGYSAGGAIDTPSYKAWIKSLARGIGQQPTVLILEPDGLGIIPFHTALNGKKEWCQPMVLDALGNNIPAPGASPKEVYSQLNYAVQTLKEEAPRALVYLDGTHSHWLPVGEIAYRLVKAGVLKIRGFSLNISSFQSTWQEMMYGSWISRCIYYANHLAVQKGQAEAYRTCPTQPLSSAPTEAWHSIDAWYRSHVDEAAHPSPEHDLVHFVIDTSRNGRGLPSLDRYTEAPFHQPASILEKLTEGAWCNPPAVGVGIQPSTDTGHPLVDAFFWIKIVGESDGSCDISGGSRAWDYTKYNPWELTGETQKHFDPLWGMVTPPAGAWFPEQALRLAENANPPLIP